MWNLETKTFSRSSVTKTLMVQSEEEIVQEEVETLNADNSVVSFYEREEKNEAADRGQFMIKVQSALKQKMT